MKSLWPEVFEAKKVKPVKTILNEQSKLLPKLTGDMVFASVVKTNAIQPESKNDFSYFYFLKGRFLKSYSFKVLDFSHGVTIYPVVLTLDELIAKELNLNEGLEFNGEEEFIKFLGSIYKSERLKDVIESIIQLSTEKSLHTKENLSY